MKFNRISSFHMEKVKDTRHLGLGSSLAFSFGHFPLAIIGWWGLTVCLLSNTKQSNQVL